MPHPKLVACWFEFSHLGDRCGQFFKDQAHVPHILTFCCVSFSPHRKTGNYNLLWHSIISRLSMERCGTAPSTSAPTPAICATCHGPASFRCTGCRSLYYCCKARIVMLSSLLPLLRSSQKDLSFCVLLLMRMWHTLHKTLSRTHGKFDACQPASASMSLACH